ncbi:type IV pilus twitching motility protein PilT [uncultured Jatrophihabitans sp.]|uniref:type IV pilus twitching motility protein PilT n=1 Tax=uncultured Jatrophihabitans sp. TaxID=1610747 RepID=UPI0035C9CD5A
MDAFSPLTQPADMAGSSVALYTGALLDAAPIADLPAASPSLPPSVDGPAHSAPVVRHATRDSALAKGLNHDDYARTQLNAMLTAMVRAGGSDLHITVGRPPMARIHGDLTPLAGFDDVLRPADTEAIVRCVVTPGQWAQFERDLEFDLAYSLDGVSRFRINLYQQRNSFGSVMRSIPYEIKQLHELGIPEQIERFAALPRGLVLVTGPTGSGKTTTLAALLDLANRTRKDHIVTIEDPIEFVHAHKKCVVNQRELGVDTHSFAEALKHVLRQDPDIILVGEMRDLETVSTALTAAETGHLVLATLHTQSAAQTIDRVIDMFPAHQQQEIRAQLSTALQGVVTQSLARRPDGKGRTVVCEVMFATAAIRNLIREGKNHQIPSFMQSSGGDGMLTFDAHLAQRVHEGLVGYDQALNICHAPEEFRRLAGGAR